MGGCAGCRLDHEAWRSIAALCYPRAALALAGVCRDARDALRADVAAAAWERVGERAWPATWAAKGPEARHAVASANSAAAVVRGAVVCKRDTTSGPKRIVSTLETAVQLCPGLGRY